MADEPTQIPTQTSVPSPDDYNAALQKAMALVQGQQPKIDTTGTPNDGTRQSWTSLFGDVLGGGQGPGYQLRGQQADAAGNRALLNFGINMLLASGPQRVKPDLLSAAATGLQGAQQSLDVDQRRAALAMGAQQEYAQKQQEMRIAAVKEAIPLLTLQQQMQQAQTARQLAGSGATPPAAGGGSIATGVDSATRKAGEGGPPAPGTPGAAVAQQVHDFWRGQGYTEEQTAGIMAGGPGSESDFTPTVYGDKGTSYGLYQHHGPRLDAMRQHFGLTGSQMPTADQQNQYAAFELSPQGPLAKVGEQLRAAKTPAEAAAIFTAGFGVPADKTEIARRAGGAGRFLGPYTQAQAPPGGGVVARNPGAVQVAGPGAGTPPAAPTADLTGPRPLPPIGPGSGVATPASIANTPVQTAQAPPPPAPVVAPTQPTTPPPAPYPDIKAGEGLIRHPGTFAEFYSREFVPPPATEDFNPNLSPATQAAFAAKARSIEELYRGMGTHSPTEQPKISDEVRRGRADLQAEIQAATQAKAEAAAKALTTYSSAERDKIQTRYDAASKAYNDAAGKQAQLANDLQLERTKGEEARRTGAAASENTYVLDQRKDFAAQHDNIRGALGDYQMLRLFSDAAGKSSGIDNIQMGDKTGRDFMVQWGLGTQAQQQKWGAQQAFNAVINKSILAARQGVSMGQLSDRDMNFLQHMTVSQLENPQTRSDIISYLEQSAFRKKQYMDRVEQLWDGGQGTTWGKARTQAEKELEQTDILPNVPQNWSQLPAADQKAFITKNNLKNGSLVRGPDGKLTRYEVGQ